MRLALLDAVLLLASTAAAHPGHDHDAEQLERRTILDTFERRDLSHCADKIRERGIEAANLARRSRLAAELVKKDSHRGRDLDSLLKVSHHSSLSYTLNTPVSTIFATNNSCVLSPEVTEGPYYVGGEYVREDITENQAGVKLTLDIQVLDTATCEPVTDVYLEIWHCNSTGVYSGVSAGGNGNSATSAALLNATFLRGLQKTSSSEGAATFRTLVPGHYTGRTNHIHVMVHSANTTALANGTVMSTSAAHVGQVFFDQALVTLVEATDTYKANTQTLTTNSQDSILKDEAATSDPFVQYVMLGDTVSDGLLGWISFGVNKTASKTVSAAAVHYASGGVANSNAGGGGGGPGGGMGGGPGGGGQPPNGTTTGAGSSGTGSNTAATTFGTTASASSTVTTRSAAGLSIAGSSKAAAAAAAVIAVVVGRWLL